MQRGEDKKLSLSLQTVGHALGLLSGEQAHESREDVLLTLKVSVWLRRECDIDPTSFDGYEGVKLHSTARSGSVYFQEQPEYHLDVGRHRVTTPITLLDASNKAGLWIDLERYSNKQSPECIMWRSAGKHPFFIIPQALEEPHLKSLARSAVQQFKGINLRNFFKQSKCDIEMDIYRLDFDNLAQYVQAVQSNDKRCLDSCTIPEAKVLWTRRLLANPRALIDDPKTAEMLRQYASYRYGGEMQIARSVSERDEDNDRDFHPSLSDMMLRLTQSKEAAVISSNKEDQRLLESLERFILDSDIVRVAGEKLLPHYWPNLHKRVESHS